MPVMPRPKNFGTKIAYKVLGVPDALLFKESAKQKKINFQLRELDTRRVR